MRLFGTAAMINVQKIVLVLVRLHLLVVTLTLTSCSPVTWVDNVSLTVDGEKRACNQPTVKVRQDLPDDVFVCSGDLRTWIRYSSCADQCSDVGDSMTCALKDDLLKACWLSMGHVGPGIPVNFEAFHGHCLDAGDGLYVQSDHYVACRAGHPLDNVTDLCRISHPCEVNAQDWTLTCKTKVNPVYGLFCAVLNPKGMDSTGSSRASSGGDSTSVSDGKPYDGAGTDTALPQQPFGKGDQAKKGLLPQDEDFYFPPPPEVFEAGHEPGDGCMTHEQSDQALPQGLVPDPPVFLSAPSKPDIHVSNDRNSKASNVFHPYPNGLKDSDSQDPTPPSDNSMRYSPSQKGGLVETEEILLIFPGAPPFPPPLPPPPRAISEEDDVKPDDILLIFQDPQPPPPPSQPVHFQNAHRSDEESQLNGHPFLSQRRSPRPNSRRVRRQSVPFRVAPKGLESGSARPTFRLSDARKETRILNLPDVFVIRGQRDTARQRSASKSRKMRRRRSAEAPADFIGKITMDDAYLKKPEATRVPLHDVLTNTAVIEENAGVQKESLDANNGMEHFVLIPSANTELLPNRAESATADKTRPTIQIIQNDMRNAEKQYFQPPQTEQVHFQPLLVSDPFSTKKQSSELKVEKHERPTEHVLASESYSPWLSGLKGSEQSDESGDSFREHDSGPLKSTRFDIDQNGDVLQEKTSLTDAVGDSQNNDFPLEEPNLSNMPEPEPPSERELGSSDTNTNEDDNGKTEDASKSASKGFSPKSNPPSEIKASSVGKGSRKTMSPLSVLENELIPALVQDLLTSIFDHRRKNVTNKKNSSTTRLPQLSLNNKNSGLESQKAAEMTTKKESTASSAASKANPEQMKGKEHKSTKNKSNDFPEELNPFFSLMRELTGIRKAEVSGSFSRKSSPDILASFTGDKVSAVGVAEMSPPDDNQESDEAEIDMEFRIVLEEDDGENPEEEFEKNGRGSDRPGSQPHPPSPFQLHMGNLRHDPKPLPFHRPFPFMPGHHPPRPPMMQGRPGLDSLWLAARKKMMSDQMRNMAQNHDQPRPYNYGISSRTTTKSPMSQHGYLFGSVFHGPRPQSPVQFPHAGGPLHPPNSMLPNNRRPTEDAPRPNHVQRQPMFSTNKAKTRDSFGDMLMFPFFDLFHHPLPNSSDKNSGKKETLSSDNQPRPWNNHTPPRVASKVFTPAMRNGGQQANSMAEESENLEKNEEEQNQKAWGHQELISNTNSEHFVKNGLPLPNEREQNQNLNNDSEGGVTSVNEESAGRTESAQENAEHHRKNKGWDEGHGLFRDFLRAELAQPSKAEQQKNKQDAQNVDSTQPETEHEINSEDHKNENAEEEPQDLQRADNDNTDQPKEVQKQVIDFDMNQKQTLDSKDNQELEESPKEKESLGIEWKMNPSQSGDQVNGGDSSKTLVDRKGKSEDNGDSSRPNTEKELETDNRDAEQSAADQTGAEDVEPDEAKDSDSDTVSGNTNWQTEKETFGDPEADYSVFARQYDKHLSQLITENEEKAMQNDPDEKPDESDPGDIHVSIKKRPGIQDDLDSQHPWQQHASGSVDAGHRPTHEPQGKDPKEHNGQDGSSHQDDINIDDQKQLTAGLPEMQEDDGQQHEKKELGDSVTGETKNGNSNNNPEDNMLAKNVRPGSDHTEALPDSGITEDKQGLPGIPVTGSGNVEADGKVAVGDAKNEEASGGVVVISDANDSKPSPGHVLINQSIVLTQKSTPTSQNSRSTNNSHTFSTTKSQQESSEQWPPSSDKKTNDEKSIENDATKRLDQTRADRNNPPKQDGSNTENKPYKNSDGSDSSSEKKNGSVERLVKNGSTGEQTEQKDKTANNDLSNNLRNTKIIFTKGTDASGVFAKPEENIDQMQMEMSGRPGTKNNENGSAGNRKLDTKNTIFSGPYPQNSAMTAMTVPSESPTMTSSDTEKTGLDSKKAKKNGENVSDNLDSKNNEPGSNGAKTTGLNSENGPVSNDDKKTIPISDDAEKTELESRRKKIDPTVIDMNPEKKGPSDISERYEVLTMKRNANPKVTKRNTNQPKLKKKRNSDQSKLKKRNVNQSKLKKRNVDQSKLNKRKVDQSKIKKRNVIQSKLKKRNAEQSNINKRNADHSKLKKRNADQSKLKKRNAKQSNLKKRNSNHPNLAKRNGEQSKLAKRNIDLPELTKKSNGRPAMKAKREAHPRAHHEFGHE